MSAVEIIKELPKLTTEERSAVRRRLRELEEADEKLFLHESADAMFVSLRGMGYRVFSWLEDVEPGGHHMNVIRAFVGHILRGEPMVAAGSEAVNELEISNAIYLSGFKNSSTSSW
jgi:hypothetical protein